MQVLRYIHYFFYLAVHWNVRIAVHILLRETRGEKKYGIRTTGVDELKKLAAAGVDTGNATLYMPVSYDILEETLTRAGASTCRHFLDIGCGKGRALCVAASMGARKLTGIDFSRALCRAAQSNGEAVTTQYPDRHFQIFHNDAFYFDIPDDVDCIFMFNPFNEVIMSGVAENISRSYAAHPRRITLVYVNPQCPEPLLDEGFREIYHTCKLTYLEASIYHLE